MARKKFKYFGKELRAWTIDPDFSPNELARLSRFTASYIYSILAGERLPSLSAVLVIIKAVECKAIKKYGCKAASISLPSLLDSYILDYLRADREREKIVKMAKDRGIISEHF